MTPIAAALRRATAHLFVESLDVPLLDEADQHHLQRVLRVRPTDPLTVSDGRGGWAEARWDPGAGGLVRVGEVVRIEPGVRCGVAMALAKGERTEWAVQKLTELGMAEIRLFAAERAVVRWDGERGERQLARLRRVAREAAMQSRRVELPDVELVPFAAVSGPQVAFADPSGVEEIDRSVTTVAIGPEGGFTEAEIAACGRRVTLGAQILRVETAAVAAAVLLQAAHRPRA